MRKNEATWNARFRQLSSNFSSCCSSQFGSPSSDSKDPNSTVVSAAQEQAKSAQQFDHLTSRIDSLNASLETTSRSAAAKATALSSTIISFNASLHSIVDTVQSALHQARETTSPPVANFSASVNAVRAAAESAAVANDVLSSRVTDLNLTVSSLDARYARQIVYLASMMDGLNVSAISAPGSNGSVSFPKTNDLVTSVRSFSAETEQLVSRTSSLLRAVDVLNSSLSRVTSTIESNRLHTESLSSNITQLRSTVVALSSPAPSSTTADGVDFNQLRKETDNLQKEIRLAAEKLGKSINCCLTAFPCKRSSY